MKLISFLIITFLGTPLFQTGFYSIQLVNLNGVTVSLSAFQNKKIIIAPFSAGAPEAAQLQFLDSLQNANPTIKIIAVAANDFAGPGSIESLKNLRRSLSLSLLMTSPMEVKKTSGLNQHPLFKWLTDVNRNTHFNSDAEAGGQLFMISPGGNLYSVLGAGVPVTVVNEVVQQVVN